MTASVEFHTGVADPLGFACRLLRKAYRSGVRVLVTVPADELAVLDRALWTFSAQDFIPHTCWPASDVVLARSPIVLTAAELPPDAPKVLINLGASAPADASTFERIVEIVAAAPEAAAGGRERWRHYESWGVQPLHHAAQ